MRPGDLYMKVGVEPYPSAGDFIAEAKRIGASKRLPSVPTGAVQDVTRFFLVHPMAIASIDGWFPGLSEDDRELGQAWKMLFQKLMSDLEAMTIDNAGVHAAFYRRSAWHCGSDLLAQVHATKDANALALLKKYRVKFHPGIFGYFYLAQLQGVVGHEDDDVDEALKRADVVPVFVVREGEDGL